MMYIYINLPQDLIFFNVLDLNFMIEIIFSISINGRLSGTRIASYLIY